MLFQGKKEHLELNIEFYGTTLKQVSATKFLGVTIDEKLSWEQYVNQVAQE